MVSLRRPNSRGVLDWTSNFSITQLLRPLYVLVFLWSVDASRASHATKVVVDRVEILRGTRAERIVEVASPAGYSIAHSITMKASATMRMPLLDVAFYLMDSVRSPQDFTLIFHLVTPPDVDSFYAGAKSAMNRFPTSASVVVGQTWVWRENKYFRLRIVSTGSDSETRSAIEQFIDEPFDLRHQPPIRQMLIVNDRGGSCLVTRFHHAAADGLSAALWLGHQLNVAYGVETVELDRAPFAGPALRRLPTSVRRSEFAFDGASDRLWTPRSNRSGSRRWLTVGFPSSDLQKACRRAGGFTYNDLLATCTLEVLSQWNNKHRNNSRPKIGLWVPMNVRRELNSGFGNGTSRIRLYKRYNIGASFPEKCRAVRQQVSWTNKNGEWVLPDIPWFTRLPRQLAGPLLRSYLRLPSVDMATAVFSHAGSWIANAGDAFKHVEQIESVGLLHPRQSLAINAATHGQHTWLSFTYDPNLLGACDVQQLALMYEKQVALAADELI